MKKRKIPIVLFVLMLVGYSSASACVCDLPLANISLKSAVAKAKSQAVVVFSGEVIELADFSVKFKVDRTWKGAVSDYIVMSSGGGKAENGDLIISTCAFRFSLGEKYLVYAYGSGGNLSTTKCTRTAHIENATEDLAMLNRLAPIKNKQKRTSFIGGKG